MISESMLIAVLIIILIVAVGIGVSQNRGKDNRAEQQSGTQGLLSSEKEEELKRINAEKMARLRELKAQKKIEQEKAEERARIEKAKREEAERKEAERIKRLRQKTMAQCKETFEKYGLSDVKIFETDDYLYDLIEKWEWDIQCQADENLDVEQLFTFLNEHKDLYSSVSITIQSSCAQNLLFKVYSGQSLGIVKKGDSSPIRFKSSKPVKDCVWCFCENEKQKVRNEKIADVLIDGVSKARNLDSEAQEINAFFTDILHASDYQGTFSNQAAMQCENEIALIEYELPSRNDLSWVKEYKYVPGESSIKETLLPEATIVKMYENLIYSICLRSIYELCVSKRADEIKSVVFNGFVSAINKANGLKERKCILSLQVAKEKFLQVDLANVDPKICFKSFKGVSAARLIDISPVQPVLSFNKNDRRFIQGKDVQMNSGTNLASMDWEDFEHLVRELFEMEFARNGGEVRVTQASRDGGVDAIAFDPDPLRGGKIVIQAKRYTNTVGVSAVRDLYGTVINEGANTGILITTSDYGHDSYEFAKDKPLKLLNGGHLLALLHKNGKEGYINIQEAKENLKDE